MDWRRARKIAKDPFGLKPKAKSIAKSIGLYDYATGRSQYPFYKRNPEAKSLWQKSREKEAQKYMPEYHSWEEKQWRAPEEVKGVETERRYPPADYFGSSKSGGGGFGGSGGDLIKQQRKQKRKQKKPIKR